MFQDKNILQNISYCGGVWSMPPVTTELQNSLAVVQSVVLQEFFERGSSF